jgi:predicted RecA/RadA family phage recombinase
MKNQRYTHNKHIALTALADVTSGQPVKIGQYVGVTVTAAKAGEKVTVWLDGSYDVPVTGAVAEAGIVYIKGDNTLTATATGNYPFGVANAAKGTGTAPLEVAPFGKITNTAALA